MQKTIRTIRIIAVISFISYFLVSILQPFQQNVNNFLGFAFLILTASALVSSLLIYFFKFYLKG